MHRSRRRGYAGGSEEGTGRRRRPRALPPSRLEVVVTVTHDDVVRWIRAFADAIAENKDYLTDLDSAIGDADHGINMHRGMTAVVQKLDAGAGDELSEMFKGVGMTLVSTVGGAGGPLYGTLFRQSGTTVTGRAALGPG